MFSRHKLAVSAAVLSFALAGPALAQNNSNAVNAQKVVAGATQDIHNLSANPNFTNLLKRAKGVFIVPSFFKGAFVVGGSGGTGVLLAHDNGHWSDPAFLTLGSVSIGAQAGAKGGTLVMFLMTDKAVADFTQNNNFSLNANSSLAVIKWSPAAQGSAGKGDALCGLVQTASLPAWTSAAPTSTPTRATTRLTTTTNSPTRSKSSKAKSAPRTPASS